MFVCKHCAPTTYWGGDLFGLGASNMTGARNSVPGVTLPAGTALAWHETLDSTNEEARRRALAGERGPLWIVTEQQTAGRGRRGRPWTSAAGNLAATLLCDPGVPPERTAQLSFAAALAVAETVAGTLDAAVEMKWPNDVLVRQRKIAGILLESSGPGGVWLAIGIGLNLASHPEGMAFPATSVAAEGGRVPSVAAALTALAAALDGWIARFRAEGFAPLHAAWTARAARLGGPLSVRLASETLTGTFLGLDADGALKLALANGTERLISAGDVFF